MQRNTIVDKFQEKGYGQSIDRVLTIRYLDVYNKY